MASSSSMVSSAMGSNGSRPWDFECPGHDLFRARMTICTKTDKVMRLLRNKLTDNQKKLFRASLFGKFLDLDFSFSGMLVHNVLVRRVQAPEAEGKRELWFQMGNDVIRLGIREWCLVTGLDCSQQKEDGVPTAKSDRLRKQYFPLTYTGKHALEDVDVAIKDLEFKEIPDHIAVMIAQYYFADRMLMARPEKNKADLNLMGLMDQKRVFEKIHFGRLSWNVIYEYAMKSNDARAKKFLSTQASDPLHKDERYTFYGFAHGIQAWIFEAIGQFASAYAQRLTVHNHPRIFRWKLLKAPEDTVIKDVLKRKDLNLLRILTPSDEELAEPYWGTVFDVPAEFPDWVAQFDLHRATFSEHVCLELVPSRPIRLEHVVEVPHDQPPASRGEETPALSVSFRDQTQGSVDLRADVHIGDFSHGFMTSISDDTTTQHATHEQSVPHPRVDVGLPGVVQLLKSLQSNIRDEHAAFRQSVMAELAVVREEIAAISAKQTAIDERHRAFETSVMHDLNNHRGTLDAQSSRREQTSPSRTCSDHVDYTPTIVTRLRGRSIRKRRVTLT